MSVNPRAAITRRPVCAETASLLSWRCSQAKQDVVKITKEWLAKEKQKTSAERTSASEPIQVSAMIAN